MEDFINSFVNWSNAAMGVVATVVAWWTSKFGEGKKSKIALGVAAFVVLIVILTALQAMFGG